MTPEENLNMALRMVNKAMSKPPQKKDGVTCGRCDGSGMVDSGGQDQTGRWVNVPCPDCERERREERWRKERDSLDNPVVYDVDENGELQVIGTGLHHQGWVDSEQYTALLEYVEELEGRAREVQEAVKDLIP